MATYKVRHEETSVGYFDVEADSTHDAIEKFQKKYQDEGVDLSQMEVVRELDSASTGRFPQYSEECGEATYLARGLLSYVNQHPSAAGAYHDFATIISRDHKTLQQSVMRLFIATIREMANVTPDARNEQTVELAKKIVEIADGYSLPLI